MSTLHEIGVLLTTSLGDMVQKFAAAKGYITDFSKQSSKVDIDVNTTNAKSKITDLSGALSKLQQTLQAKQLALTIETSESELKIEKLQTEISRLLADIIGKKAELKISTAAGSSDVTKLSRQIEDMELQAKGKKIDLDVTTEKSQAKINSLAGDINRIQQQIANKKTDVNINTDKAKESLGGLGGVLNTIQNAIYKVQLAFWTVQTVLAAGLSVKFAVELDDQMEKWDLQLRVITKDATLAKQIMSQLQEFADTTPFKTESIHEAGVALTTAGIGADQLMGYMQSASDWAAAFNTDISETARVFARINSGDTGEALERARDFGISMRDLWAQGIQFDAGGQVLSSVSDTMDAVKNAVTLKTAGMSQELSKTWSGMWSTFTSLANQSVRDLTGGTFQGLKAELSTINDKMKELNKSGSFKDLGSDLQELEGAIGSVLGAINQLSTGQDGGAKVLGDFSTMVKGLYEDIVQLIKLLGDLGNAFNNLNDKSSGLLSIGNNFELVGKMANTFAHNIAYIGSLVQKVGASWQYMNDLKNGGRDFADENYAQALEKINQEYIERSNRIDGVKSAEKQLAETQQSTADAAKKAQQDAQNQLFNQIQAAQKDVQSANAVAQTKIAVEKAYHANSVQLANEQYRVAAENYQKLGVLEEQFQAMVEGNGKEYKPTQQYLDAKKAYAEALSAVYQAQIDQADALGQYTYQAQKIIDEAGAIEVLGGDSTLKRYEALKSAIMDYLSELDKIRQAQIEAWSNMAQLNIMVNNYNPESVREIGRAWSDNSIAIINYRQQAGLNLEAVERQSETLANSEKLIDADRLKERLMVLQQMLSSEQLGAQQRKQLISEEAQVFNQYTRTISDGIKNAMSKISSLQQNIMSSASSAMSLLKDMGANSDDIQQAYLTGFKAFGDKQNKTLQDYQAMWTMYKQMTNEGFTEQAPFQVSDVKQALSSLASDANTQIQQLRSNMASLIDDAKQIGAFAAQNYFSEWTGYIDSLRQTIGSVLSVPISFDMSNLNDAIAAAKDQLQQAFSNLQTSITLDIPKPIINYNNFALSPTYQIQVQGSTIKDVQDIIAQTTDDVGRTMRDALQEAVVQYGL